MGDVGSFLELGDVGSTLEVGDLGSVLEVGDVALAAEGCNFGGGPIEPMVGLEDVDEAEEYPVPLTRPLFPCARAGVALVIDTFRTFGTLVLFVPESETLEDSCDVAGVEAKTRESRR